jgi:DNA-binding XRE family transcriptional regulator
MRGSHRHEYLASQLADEGDEVHDFIAARSPDVSAALPTETRAHFWCYAFRMYLSRNDAKVVLVALGAEVRRRRQKLGLSQAKFAAKAEIHVNVVGRTERGIYNPTLIVLYAIAGALDTSLVDLLSGPPRRSRGRD